MSIVICPDCKHSVELNGIGSNRNTFQRTLTALLQFVVPFTSETFHESSKWHDLAVHQGCPEHLDFEVWVQITDAKFHRLCLKDASKKSNWFKRMYFKNQADELYEALKFNDGSGYDEINCYARSKYAKSQL